ncbi:hypothetical protein MPSEU_000890500 [Mayamaea pseudoterrestris]|nr:hypothetical protein MPSEU_000890500 [Mayamaea pseudoterrestris]
MNSSAYLNFNNSIRESTYEPPDEVIKVSDTPRFGHSSEIVDILGSRNELKDYVTGLIFGAAIIFAFFLIWIIATFVFKYLGKERVGFLSGAPFNATPTRRKDFPSEQARPQIEDWDEELEKEYYRMQFKSRINPSWKNKPTIIRIAFLLCGLVYVILSILLVTKGVANLFQTVHVFQRSLERVDLIANSTQVLLNNLRPVAASSQNIYDGLSSQVSGSNFCPNDPSLSFSTQAQEVQSQAQDAVDQLGQFNEILDASLLNDLEAVLARYYDFANPFNKTLSTVDVNNWQIIVAIVPVNVVAVLMMAGTLLAIFTIDFPFYGAFLNYVLCPLMFIICTVCWLTAGLMAMGAGLNGDFCLPGGRVGESSPDETILNMMEASGNGPTDEEFDMYTVAKYYVKQCQVGANPFGFIEAVIPRLVSGQEVLGGLDGMFNNTAQISLLSFYCGRDYAQLQTVLSEFVDLVGYLLEAAVRVLELVSCTTIVPLYVNTVYDGMCTYSPIAVYWVFEVSSGRNKLTQSFHFVMRVNRSCQAFSLSRRLSWPS